MQEKNTNLMLMGILVIILISVFSITPIRLVLFDEIKESSNTLIKFIKNRYITEDKLEQYDDCQFRLGVGNGGCKLYECSNGKRLIVKGWYDWSDTISYCGLD